MANCMEESEGWLLGREDAIFTSPSGGAFQVFLPEPASVIFPSSTTLSAGLSQVLLTLFSEADSSECDPASLSNCVLSPKFVCPALTKASVFTPLAISDTRLGLGAESGVEALSSLETDFSSNRFSRRSSLSSVISLEVWVPDACVICSCKLSNRACSCTKNWALAGSSNRRRMCHWARNSLYSTSRLSSS